MGFPAFDNAPRPWRVEVQKTVSRPPRDRIRLVDANGDPIAEFYDRIEAEGVADLVNRETGVSA